MKLSTFVWKIVLCCGCKFFFSSTLGDSSMNRTIMIASQFLTCRYVLRRGTTRKGFHEEICRTPWLVRSKRDVPLSPANRATCAHLFFKIKIGAGTRWMRKSACWLISHHTKKHVDSWTSYQKQRTEGLRMDFVGSQGIQKHHRKEKIQIRLS